MEKKNVQIPADVMLRIKQFVDRFPGVFEQDEQAIEAAMRLGLDQLESGVAN